MMRGARLIAAGRAVLVGGLIISLAGVGLLVGATAPAGAVVDAVSAPRSPSQLTIDWSSTHGGVPADDSPTDDAPAAPASPTPDPATAADPTESPAPTPAPTPNPTPTPTAAAPGVPGTGASDGTSGAAGGESGPSSAAPPPGDADFGGLTVTVSQTQNLVNQGIRISWSGGTPTSPGEFATDYLSIMQCWGDDAAGPTPQQCQWGTPTSTIGNLLGANAGSRDLTEGEDPLQVYADAIKRKPPRSNPNLRSFAFPFQSVRGGSSFDPQDYFTSATTNEISAARTGNDGTGSTAFEVQTSLEAPHLGCGAVLPDGSGRSCWLVIVPRGSHNLDGGLAADGSTSGRVLGSPLSASAWRNRIVVPLGFQPVSVSCPIGNAERRVVGSEIIADAFTSWQPALCGDGATYGFSQLGDGEGRAQILSDVQGGSKLAFVSSAVDPAGAGTSTLRYAAVANSAMVIAYNIDYTLQSNSPIFGRNGTQVSNLVLNARLVAKLLTQSYRADIPDGGVADGLRGNPRSLVQDPEFLALNPDFAGFVSNAAPDGLMVALGSSDANALVWNWVRSDPLAAQFLSGTPDDWGMQLNPYYKTLSLATATTDSYPKADLSTQQASPAPPPGFGTLDMRPYTNDAHEAAFRTLRADSNVKIVWDQFRAPPSYVSSGPQLPGQRMTLSIVDAASAQRYGLNTAKLVNAAGQVVGVSASTVSTALAAAVPSTTTGVRPMSPEARIVGAYPLSMPVYAAINVCASSPKELKDYEALIEYAIGTGQVTGDAKGQLPRGYVPLSEADVKASTAVVKALRAGIDCTPDAPDQFPDFGTGGYEIPADSGGGNSTPPATDPEEAPRHEVVDPALTPGRLGVIGALALGIPCMIAGPILSARGRRLSTLEGAEDNGD